MQGAYLFVDPSGISEPLHLPTVHVLTWYLGKSGTKQSISPLVGSNFVLDLTDVPPLPSTPR